MPATQKPPDKRLKGRVEYVEILLMRGDNIGCHCGLLAVQMCLRI
jgi:hypothetical protein